MDMIHSDFKKDFGNVDHGLLLAKVKAFGVTGKLGAWLGSVVLGRK